MVETAIEFREFSLFYGTRQVIPPLNLSIPKGKLTAWIGPSGCGKSSCLRAINRMQDRIRDCRIQGQIFVEGIPIYRSDLVVEQLRKRVGMVFQRPNVFPMSIERNLFYGPKLQGVRKKAELREIAERTLRAVGLWGEVKDRLGQSAGSLSGGQQQRLCIARALTIRPSVLLLDEPTSALDPEATQAVETLLRSLKGDYTMILVTHQLRQAQVLADEVQFFREGKLVESGSPEQLFEHPRQRATKEYLHVGR